jgi:hypothetical protein
MKYMNMTQIYKDKLLLSKNKLSEVCLKIIDIKTIRQTETIYIYKNMIDVNQ